MKRRRPSYPSLSLPIRALIRDVAARLPEFAHLRPAQILVVAGEARRASRATVRPMHFPRTHSRLRQDGRREKPLLKVGGQEILYVITLRPLWFRHSTAEQRVGSLIHELYHVSTRFDGTLHPGRRHAKLGEKFNRRLRPLVRRYLAEAPPELLAPLGRSGLVRVRMWLEKPPASLPVPLRKRARRLYTEEQLYTGLARLLTR